LSVLSLRLPRGLALPALVAVVGAMVLALAAVDRAGAVSQFTYCNTSVAPYSTCPSTPQPRRYTYNKATAPNGWAVCQRISFGSFVLSRTCGSGVATSNEDGYPGSNGADVDVRVGNNSSFSHDVFGEAHYVG